MKFRMKFDTGSFLCGSSIAGYVNGSLSAWWLLVAVLAIVDWPRPILSYTTETGWKWKRSR